MVVNGRGSEYFGVSFLPFAQYYSTRLHTRGEIEEFRGIVMVGEGALVEDGARITKGL